MQPQIKRNLMLAVLAVLLIARFILVPVFEWQQEQIDQIAAKAQRLVKTEHIVKRLPQINEALAQLKQSNQQQQVHYFKHDSMNRFKLQLQQKIENIFSQSNIKVTNFNWVAETTEQITQARARVTFQGATKDFVLLQLAMAQLPELLNINQWDLHIKRMDTRSLGKANGNLVLTAYNISPNVEAP